MKTEKDLLPLQPGDIPDTYAGSTKLEKAVGHKPGTLAKEGVARFIAEYCECYKV